MDLRPFGSTGLLVSPIGLGTVKIGRTQGLKYPLNQRRPLPSDDQVDALFARAADLGVNVIDTAPAYGAAETRIGEAMTRLSWLGGRDRWVVCSKVGEEFDDQTGESRYDFSPGHIRMSVERSLRRLGTDVLDVVLLHCDEREQWIIEQSGACEALRELVRRGHVRSWGVSTKTVDGSLMAMRRSQGAADVVMLAYNPVNRQEAYAIDAAAHRGIGVLVKKALGSGHLDELWLRTPAEFKIAAMAELEHGGQPTAPSRQAQPHQAIEAAIRFALARSGVSSVVVGTASPDHLAWNVAAAEHATRRP